MDTDASKIDEFLEAMNKFDPAMVQGTHNRLPIRMMADSDSFGEPRGFSAALVNEACDRFFQRKGMSPGAFGMAGHYNEFSYGSIVRRQKKK